MEVFLIIVVAVFVIGAVLAHNSEKEKQRAKQAYENSLHALTSNPTSSELRQKTLALGRQYSNLMRDKKGNTIFDEVALMNDISAACASAHHAVAPQTSRQDVTVEDRLLKLQSLRSSGLIDDDDFSRRKREIMEQV